MTSTRRMIVFIGVALVSASLISCARRVSPQAQAIRIGVPALEQNALLYIAADHGLFAPQGLDVTIDDFDTGPASIAAMISGTVDVAETAEYPLVVSTMAGRPLRILVENDRFENGYLVVRRDRGISKIADLRGKRIGVTLGAIPEFYLGRFLTLNGLRGEDVMVVNVRPTDFLRSISEGQVDALVAWQPFVSQMTTAEPGTLTAWPVQSNQAAYGILVTTEVWLARSADAARRFLKVLATAEDVLDRDPAGSRAAVAKRLHYSDSYVSEIWPRHDFSLTLDFSLVAAMEDEARWLLARGLTPPADIPDFMSLISRDSLAAVRRRAST